GRRRARFFTEMPRRSGTGWSSARRQAPRFYALLPRSLGGGSQTPEHPLMAQGPACSDVRFNVCRHLGVFPPIEGSVKKPPVDLARRANRFALWEVLSSPPPKNIWLPFFVNM